MRASPESLSRMRRNAGLWTATGSGSLRGEDTGSALLALLGRLDLRGHLGGEVVRLLLQPLAQGVAGEAADGDLLTGLGGELQHEGADVLLRVLDELLVEEADVLLP